ncbi:MAG TPA: ATP-binding protein [Spirillospora sp.]|nr:ATP-binding protein [Spirillospora sp.]
MEAGDFAAGRPTLVVGPSDQAPGLARRFLVERFRELGLGDDYVGRLVVTELVTNAYKHVGFGRIVVRVAPDASDGLVLIEVCDEGRGRPVAQPEDHEATGGRGLQLMAELVREWGVRPLDEGGKAVWARYAP